MEARRELVKQNVALLKQEEEERRAKEGSSCKSTSTGKTGGPDLKSFIRQFPTASEGNKLEEESDAVDKAREGESVGKKAKEPEPSEPTGSGSPSSQGHGSHRHEMDYINTYTANFFLERLRFWGGEDISDRLASLFVSAKTNPNSGPYHEAATPAIQEALEGFLREKSLNVLKEPFVPLLDEVIGIIKLWLI